MSLLLPHSPKQAAEWEARSRGPEPLLVGALPGWQRSELLGTADGLHPNERLIILTRGAATVHVMRSWDRPLNPGYPMVSASKRPVIIDGRAFELEMTSMFAGVAQVVEVLFVVEPTWQVRIVFERTTPGEVAEVLAAIRFATS